MPADELLDLLVRKDLCVDGRRFGAPVYLDATAAGLPLRALVGADGQANYLLSTLRELVPQLPGQDHVVLVHDPEIRADYRTIAHVLTALGTEVSRIELSRVPLDGVAAGTRYGGWRRYTLGALASAHGGGPAFALAMRLYLIAGLARITTESFTARQLRRWVGRAGRLVAEHGGRRATPAVGAGLSALTGRQPYADPYRVIATLLGRDPVVPHGDLLDVVLGPAERAQALQVA